MYKTSKTRDGSLSCRIENASKTENRPLSCTVKILNEGLKKKLEQDALRNS